MTNNANNSGWVTATGETASSGPNLGDTQAQREPQAVVGKGGLEITGYGPVRVSGAPATYTAGQEAPTDGSIMGTVKAQHGGQIIGRNPNGNDIVSIGGMTTSINAAVASGFLARNHDGSFSDKEAPATLRDPAAEAGAKTPARAETAGQVEGEPAGVSFGQAADAAMEDFMAGQNPSDLSKTLDSVLHRGDVDKATIERMASTAGIEPHEMAEKVNTVWQGAHDAASAYMAEAGVEDGEAFAAFMSENPRLQNDLREAARNYFVHHKAEGLQTMAEAYLPQMDRYEGARVREMLTDAGYTFEEDGRGGIRVNVSGSPMSWEVAVKQGIITFSRG